MRKFRNLTSRSNHPAEAIGNSIWRSQAKSRSRIRDRRPSRSSIFAEAAWHQSCSSALWEQEVVGFVVNVTDDVSRASHTIIGVR
jgi:hypothetical protein